MLHGSPQIYHHYEAIFIHIPKVAGTSIERILKLNPKENYGGHSTAIGIKKHYPKEFGEYYKFSFVRNPYDRVSSAYFYLKNSPLNKALQNHNIKDSIDINDYIKNYFPNDHILHLWPQYKFITDQDIILVDDVFRYENLEEDWEKVCNKLKINLKLPYFNPSKKDSFKYTSNSINTINEFYKKDFELFGYELKSNYI